ARAAGRASGVASVRSPRRRVPRFRLRRGALAGDDAPLLRGVVAETLGDPRPAARMLGEVGLLVFVGACDLFETAFDEAQACRVASGFEAELDEWRVRLVRLGTVGMLPTEGEEVGRLEPFDPQVDDHLA